MSASILTASVIGIEGYRVLVECDISPGLPAFLMVGLADAAVKEARERAKSAMRQAELPFPRTKVTINLAPANLKKTGSGFDLPMAIAILTANGDLPEAGLEKRLLIGELALDGTLRPVNGVLSIALLAQRLRVEELIVPKDNSSEAAAVPGIKTLSAETLRQVVEHISGVKMLPVNKRKKSTLVKSATALDFATIRGQEQSKRALEIAAAGGHNVLMHGPPGSGKTLLAQTFSSILPELTYEEALEVTQIHSVAGLMHGGGLNNERPFRAPHHSASGVALVGGGTIPQPGEISLAHRGVLFLDEAPEFSRHVLENLRQPQEDGCVCVSRAHGSVMFPARFQLLAAMNPCPCGFASDPDRACNCTPTQLIKYNRRLSGPLLDRIDVIIEVPKVPTDQLVNLQAGESSAEIRRRVKSARLRQLKRYKRQKIFTNAELSSDQVRRLIAVSNEARELLRAAVDRYHLSARTYFRLLKVAQTIADLAESETINSTHIAEALQFRRMTND